MAKASLQSSQELQASVPTFGGEQLPSRRHTAVLESSYALLAEELTQYLLNEVSFAGAQLHKGCFELAHSIQLTAHEGSQM